MKGIDSAYNFFFKRVLDVFCSLCVILLLWWVFIIVAVLVRIFLGSPVIFKQERPGMIDKKTGKEKMFMLYKFRTMTNAKDENGELLPASERLTKFGRFLRSTSLDELPESINILKGEMSIVGPRPLWANYLKYYNDFERRRHLVRPGLTGWAQVNGRNTASWKRRFEMDAEYVENISFLFDLKILALTVKKVFARDGVEFPKGHQPILEYFADRENAC